MTDIVEPVGIPERPRRMTEESFEIFKLGFYAGKNAERKNALKDLDFWYTTFVKEGI